MTYVLEIINSQVSIIRVFFVLVSWFSCLTPSSTNVVHLGIRVSFLYVFYGLFVCSFGETYVCVSCGNKNLEP